MKLQICNVNNPQRHSKRLQIETTDRAVQYNNLPGAKYSARRGRKAAKAEGGAGGGGCNSPAIIPHCPSYP